MKSRASANPPKAADLSFLKEVQYGWQADQPADPAAESAGRRRNSLVITFSRLVWNVSDQMICIVRFRSGGIFRTYFWRFAFSALQELNQNNQSGFILTTKSRARPMTKTLYMGLQRLSTSSVRLNGAVVKICWAGQIECEPILTFFFTNAFVLLFCLCPKKRNEWNRFGGYPRGQFFT